MSDLILHVDMDAFFASIEQQVNPGLRGKPVIIGGRNNKYRSIICAASYEAKALGINNAMPSWKALRICPRAIFVAADTAKYVHTSNQIFKILKRFSPQVEKFSIDEFFLDIDGCERLFGSPEEMGKKIKMEIKNNFGITCSIGIAPTKITSKLAAKMHKPDGLCFLDKQQALKVLKDLPIEKICGIGDHLKKRFHRLGIQTCGELGRCPQDILEAHFGIIGTWLKAACLVEDKGDISYFEDHNSPPKSVGHSQTLRTPTNDEEYIKDWVYLLSEMVAQRLRRKDLQGRTVHFFMSDGFGGGHGKQKTFAQPTYDGYEIYQRCLSIMESFHLSCLCVRVLGVSVSHLSVADHHYLFEPQMKRDRLLTYLDTINDKYGEWTVFPASLKEAQY